MTGQDVQAYPVGKWLNLFWLIKLCHLLQNPHRGGPHADYPSSLPLRLGQFVCHFLTDCTVLAVYMMLSGVFCSYRAEGIQTDVQTDKEKSYPFLLQSIEELPGVKWQTR